VQRFQLDRGGIIVLHTDGVTTSFRADLRAGKGTTAAQLARQIVQAYRRPQDDATCIVALVGETTHD
jgi:serine phosphatase RsbU (regulator of sigma subunit)